MDRQPRTFTMSARQIVALIIAVVALGAVIAPVAAGAANGSFVILRDPYTTTSAGEARIFNQRLATVSCDPLSEALNGTACARVAGGKLEVGDGSGPLTVDGTVSVGGTVSVNGAVSATPALPSGLESALVSVNQAGPLEVTAFGPLASSAHLAITSVNLAGDGVVDLRITTGSGCASGSGSFAETMTVVGTNESATQSSMDATFPQPLLAPRTAPGDVWCLDVRLLNGTGSGDVTVVAYPV